MRPDFQPPKLLELRPPRYFPPPGLLWFLAGSIATLLVLAALGVIP